MSGLPRSRALLFVLLLLSACSKEDPDGGGGGTACDSDPTAEAFTAGMSKQSPGGLTISIEEAEPAPPEQGRNAWRLRVTDSGGAPVDGATVEVACWMTHTGGSGSHGCAAKPEVLSLGNGEYQVGAVPKDAGVTPIVFNMGGHWDVTIIVDRNNDAGQPALPEESVVFSFCL